MCAPKMQVNERDIDVRLVGRLLAAQFPQWACLPIQSVPSAGTDNALYPLGDDMVVRLPSGPARQGDACRGLSVLPRNQPVLAANADT